MMNACTRWSFLAVPVLAALGCSSPVPLPAQGAISLSVQKPTSAVGDCPDPGNIYAVATDKDHIPSTSTPGESVIDGDSGTHITCSVRASSTGFVFSGSFNGTTLDGNHYPIAVSFDNGIVNADKVTGSASVSVFTPVLGGTYTSNQNCTITVLGDHQVKGGSIWASFSCPSIVTTPSGLCRVGPSVIVFENCDGS